jgi:superfamily II DNA or RNA helicase
VLAATTAFGKTVVAASLIAHRARNTLILVHRLELLNQWLERLRSFLKIDPKQIGVIGGGKRKPTGVIDVALIQSLVRNGEVADIVADYGHLIVDECHHLSAASFELVARRSKARYVMGLSATVARKDRKLADTAMRVSEDQERLILATGRYIGEGFDDARLDTLFLTMPIAWKGTLAQYVGRLHREHDGKKDVLVVDYVDQTVPVLARMAAKRRAGYRALGYMVE